MSEPQHHDWTNYLGFDTQKLLHELAVTHSELANLILQVGFLRQEELRGQQHAKDQRLAVEAERDAMIEKKWLIKLLLEYGA